MSDTLSIPGAPELVATPPLVGSPGERVLHALFDSLPAAPQFRRAECALASFLSGVRSSRWPDVAWRWSRLQPGGFPVEVTFSTAGESLWSAAEVAGPEAPDEARLDRAALLLAGVSGPLPDGLLAELGALQRSGPLRWGSWIGARHGPEGDRYKLYAEAPRTPAAEGFVRRHLWAAPQELCPGARIQLNAVGADAGGRLELYFRASGLKTEAVAALLARCGQEERTGEMLDLLDRLSGAPRERVLREGVWGVSLALSPQGRAEALSLYKPATYLLGADRSQRARLLALAGPGRLAAYGSATRGLAARPHDAPLCHRLLALLARPGDELELRIGVDPSRLGLAPFDSDSPSGAIPEGPPRADAAIDPRPPHLCPSPGQSR